MKSTYFIGLAIVLLSLTSPAFGQEEESPRPGVFPSPTQEEAKPVIKGLFQLQVSAAGMDRDIVEDLHGGEKTAVSTTSTQFLVKLSVKPLSLLEVYAIGGGAYLSITDVSENPFYGTIGPAYGGGFRLTFYESMYRRNIKLFLDAGFLQFWSREDDIRIEFVDVNGGSISYTEDEKFTWSEYSGLLGGSARFPLLGSPEIYGGLRFSVVDGEDSLSGAVNKDYHFREYAPLAFVMGFDFFLDHTETAAINVEAGMGEPSFIQGGLKVWF